MPTDTPEKSHLLDNYKGTNYGTCSLPTPGEVQTRQRQQFTDDIRRKQRALAQRLEVAFKQQSRVEAVYRELRARQHHGAGATDETSSLQP